MAKCAHCGERKGKRQCPALDGKICAPCCGEHRLGRIACPPDCTWLGGLAAAAGSALSADEIHAAYGPALDRFDRWCTSNPDRFSFLEKASVQIYGYLNVDVDPDDPFFPLVLAAVSYGLRDAQGRSLLDRYLSSKGRLLPVGEGAALQALTRAWASVFRVVDARPGAGLDLRDALNGDVIEVRELTASASLTEGDVLVAWVYDLGERLELTGASIMVPALSVSDVLARVNAALDAQGRADDPAFDLRRASAEIVSAAVRALDDGDVAVPAIKTADGDDLVFCTALYDLADEAAARSRLLEGGHFEAAAGDDGELIWWGDSPPDKDQDRARPLGHAVVAEGSLRLSTMSRRRHEAGRAQLEDLLGDLALHRADTFEDPEAIAREQLKRGGGGAAPRPPLEADMLNTVHEVLLQQYEGALDESIPALGDRSPRVAVETDEGREAVSELINSWEQSGLANIGELLDLDHLRAELGLPTRAEVADELAYDPAVAPDAGRWLDADESERIASVAGFHERAEGRDAEAGAKPQLHYVLHVVIENQLAGGQPRAVTEAYDRLTAAGVERHDVIHALGLVVNEHLIASVQGGAAVDEAAMASDLKALNPGDWRRP